jgi:protein-S-isoprenylcysteine O-methyltransferase Ste14
MALKEEFRRQGDWLFRWRSYLPFLLLPLMGLGLHEGFWLEVHVGRSADMAWKILAFLVSGCGLLVRGAVAGIAPAFTSGRNVEEQIADSLNTTGIYSVVRHPLYLGNFLIVFGGALFTEAGWFMLFCLFLFWVYYERIMYAEEAFLEEKFGEAFRSWAEKTPAFLPNFRAWVPSALPFSLRMVLRKEYTGFFVLVFLFTFAQFLGNGLAKQTWGLSPAWQVFFFGGAFIYLVLMALKRLTGLLNVAGR